MVLRKSVTRKPRPIAHITNPDKLTIIKSRITELNSEILNINCIGDSLTIGSHAGNNSSEWRLEGYIGILNSLFAEKYEDVGNGLLNAGYGLLSDYWTTQGTWNYQYTFGFPSFCRYTTEENAIIETIFNGTGVDVYFAKASDAGTVEILIDNVLVETVDCYEDILFANSYAFVVQITELNEGEHTLTVRKTNDTKRVYFLGACETKGTEGVRVNCMGASGQNSGAIKTQGIKDMTSSVLWDAPLTIIAYGVNDFKEQVSISTFKTNIQSIITEAQKTGDVILLYPSIRDNSSLIVSRSIGQSEYVQALHDLAILNDVCFVDMYSSLRNKENTYIYDTVHLNETGHSKLGNILYSLIKST